MMTSDDVKALPPQARTFRPRTTLTKEIVQEAKSRIASGDTVQCLADEVGIGYHAMYKIATGETWADVAPLGSVMNGGAVRGPKRRTKLRTQKLIWQLKMGGKTFAAIAVEHGISESTCQRLHAEFRLILAHRISQLQLSEGSYNQARRKYGLRTSEAMALDALAQTKPLPARLLPLLERLKKLETKE